MRKGFTLIELMIVVAIIAVIAAIAIPNLVESRIASNEAAAIASVRTYLAAQNQFRRTDFYGLGFLVYANDGATSMNTGGCGGYPDLYRIGGPAGTGIELLLVDLAFANAWVGAGTPTGRAGYLFDDLNANALAAQYDYSIDCGLAAAPGTWGRSGRNQFVIDITGTIYQNMLQAQAAPINQYPDVTATGWIPAGT